MTPVATAAGKSRSLPTHRDLPCEDKSVPQDFFEHAQARLLTAVIEVWLAQQRPGFDCAIGQDSYIYWDITTPPALGAKAPDWYLVPGVPRSLPGGEYRRSYVLWIERVIPAFAAEFISETSSGERDTTPRTGKFWVYEQGIGIPHYAIWDPWRNQLEAYRLDNGHYQPARPNERGHYPVEALGLEYGLWHGTWDNTQRLWLRWWDAGGRLLPTPQEQTEQEHRAAVMARQQAEQAQREKQELLDKLRKMGIDPDQLT